MLRDRILWSYSSIYLLKWIWKLFSCQDFNTCKLQFTNYITGFCHWYISPMLWRFVILVFPVCLGANVLDHFCGLFATQSKYFLSFFLVFQLDHWIWMYITMWCSSLTWLASGEERGINYFWTVSYLILYMNSNRLTGVLCPTIYMLMSNR